MQIGTQTNSLVNHLYSRMTKGQPAPVVGMGATLLGWTDRTPATIVGVEQFGKSTMIAVTEDSYTVVSGSMHDGSAEYEFKTDFTAMPQWYKQDKKGAWRNAQRNENGRWILNSGALRIGEREKYYDPSF